MKPRWMTPSADEAPRLRPSRSARSPRCTSAPAAATADTDASERASPDDLVACTKQLGHHSRANETTCSRDEDAHALIMRTLSRLSQTVDLFGRIGGKMKLEDDDNAAVAQVLTDYYRAFSTLDAQAIGPNFHEPSQLVSPA